MIIYFLVFTLAVIWAGIINKSRFCTMGALSDLFTFGSTNRLNMYLIAVSTAIIGTQILIYLKLFNIEHSPYYMAQIPWFSHLLGGVLFGIGMFLASGCPTQQCVNLGNGNLKSLIVIILVSISAQITFSGVLSSFRIFLQNLSYFNFKYIHIKPVLGIILGLIVFIILSIIILKNKINTKLQKFNIIFYGIATGLIVFVMWYIAGHLAFIAQDENTLDYAYIGNPSRIIQTLSMILPITSLFDWLMYSSDSMRLINLNIMLIFGLIFGSILMQILNNKNKVNAFYIQVFKNSNDLIQHLVGSILMGVGGALAFGCSIGQGLSAISFLNLGSLFSILGMYVGGKIAYKIMEI